MKRLALLSFLLFPAFAAAGTVVSPSTIYSDTPSWSMQMVPDVGNNLFIYDSTGAGVDWFQEGNGYILDSSDPGLLGGIIGNGGIDTLFGSYLSFWATQHCPGQGIISCSTAFPFGTWTVVEDSDINDPLSDNLADIRTSATYVSEAQFTYKAPFAWPNWYNAASPGFLAFTQEYQEPLVWIASVALVLALIRFALLLIRGFNIFTKRFRP